MVQKIANGDRFSVFRKVGEDIGEPVFVTQFAIMHQQHDRHRGKLLGARRQTEIRMRVNLAQGTQIGDAVTTLEDGAAIFDDEHRCPRPTGRLELAENVVDLCFRHGVRSHARWEGRKPQQP